jgi:CMP-N-acetylneuraminic acid synthetase
MRIVAFVPMKMNSLRIKNKNIVDLGGKPLYQHILGSLLGSQSVDEIYVWSSTKMEVPKGVRCITRDPLLDGDEILANDLTLRFAQDVASSDIYVKIHATSPFLSSRTIDRAVIEVLKGARGSFTATKACPLAWYQGSPLYNTEKQPRTQDMSELLIETTGLYVYKYEDAYKGNRITDESVPIYVSPFEAVDIDTEEDLEFARMLYERNSNSR